MTNPNPSLKGNTRAAEECPQPQGERMEALDQVHILFQNLNTYIYLLFLNSQGCRPCWCGN